MSGGGSFISVSDGNHVNAIQTQHAGQLIGGGNFKEGDWIVTYSDDLLGVSHRKVVASDTFKKQFKRNGVVKPKYHMINGYRLRVN